MNIAATSTLKAIAIKTGYTNSNVASETYTIGDDLVSITTAYRNKTISAQSGRFALSFDTTPLSSNMDGLSNLSLGSASDYAQLAVTLRFHPSGYIDAINGSVYAKENTVNYAAGDNFHVVMTVDVINHTYDVDVTKAGNASVRIANAYAFRSGQGAVSSLDNFSVFSVIGSHLVKNISIAGVTQEVVAPVTISPNGGSFSLAQSVSLSTATSGAQIRYTIDGTTPSASSLLYSGAFSVGSSKTIKAIGIKAGMTNSSVSSATFTIQPQVVASVAISPNGGSFSSAQSVSLSTSTIGALIRYTVDGSIPNSLSLLYAGPITVASSQTVKAIAINAGMNDSVLTSAIFTITLPPVAVAEVAISPNGGSFSSAQSVSLSTATSSAQIRYTIDGTIPSASSLLYSGAITVGSSQTIKAIGIKSGLANSSVSSAAFIITSPGVVAAVEISPATGTYTSAQAISMKSATPDAQIRYTLNGSTPTSSSLPYSAPFVVSASKTIKAIAFKSGMTMSSISTQVIKVRPRAPQKPKIISQSLEKRKGT